MNRAIGLLLVTGFALSIAAAIAESVYIILGLVLGARWFWGGAIAAYFGPAAFAIALYFNQLRLRAEKQAEVIDA